MGGGRVIFTAFSLKTSNCLQGLKPICTRRSARTDTYSAAAAAHTYTVNDLSAILSVGMDSNQTSAALCLSNPTKVT